MLYPAALAGAKESLTITSFHQSCPRISARLTEFTRGVASAGRETESRHVSRPHIFASAKADAARRLISASRSHLTLDSVALRLRAPLLKLGTVLKPGQVPDTSRIRPLSTPKPASRSAALNSAEVSCGFLLNGRSVQWSHAGTALTAARPAGSPLTCPASRSRLRPRRPMSSENAASAGRPRGEGGVGKAVPSGGGSVKE
jgi:hypothetical protein